MSQRLASSSEIEPQRFVVLCRDGEQSDALRTSALDAHRRYIDNQSKGIVVSGPLVEDDGQTRIGQFYVVDVESRSSAEEFVAKDPFTIAGVFASVEIARLLPRFLDGNRV